MPIYRRIGGCLRLFMFLLLIAGCSSTTMTGSWKNPDFSGEIDSIYVAGMARDETVRRIFEDRFGEALQARGVTGLASYRDLPDAKEADKDRVLDQVRQKRADAVLVARVIGQRTEEVVSPGRVSMYGAGPSYYGGGYFPDPYYRNIGSYYNRSREIIYYEPATVSQYQVVTIEANLYDTRTEELIWSAQLETYVDDTLDTLISDFISTVTEDLRQKGLI